MSNASIVSKQRNQNVMTTFAVVEKRIPCQHKFQFYVDYGASIGGPWIKVAINATEFGVGYLPRAKQPSHLKVAPPTAI